MFQMHKFLFVISFCVVFFSSTFLAHTALNAENIVGDLQSKILERSNEVKELEREIEKYQGEFNAAVGQGKTLGNALKTLDVTKKKLDTDIRLTEKKIDKTALTIAALTVDIGRTEESVKKNNTALAEIIRKLNDLESQSFVEIFFARETFSAFWNDVQGLEQFQKSIGQKTETLLSFKKDLEEKKGLSLSEKKRLVALSQQFVDQKELVEINKKEKQTLLAETKNKESNFRTLLEDRLAKKEALEREIQEFETRLKFELDPSKLPETAPGILSWPLQNIRVTQYFGNTSFASANPQVYNWSGHNGVDFAASVGTPVLAAAGGIVLDTGDTDIACYKVSYGKWVLVKHFNGLATLYAHLSLISVAANNEVGAHDIIGYSGNTGYTTGPHLHFAVFANDAVQVTNAYRSKICGTYLKLPLSARNGYLNPLSYLPPL